jgi:DNA-binding NtrC family response regulator
VGMHSSGELLGETPSSDGDMQTQRRMLIIDRDPGVHAALESILKDGAWELRHATDLDTAMVQIDGWQPALILLEGGDRRYLAEAVGALHTATEPAAPIVLTSQGAAGAGVAGLADYLPKPFNRDAVLWVIRRYGSTSNPTA